jgi:hypothetical protein
MMQNRPAAAPLRAARDLPPAEDQIATRHPHFRYAERFDEGSQNCL